MHPRFGEINRDIEAREFGTARADIDDILTRYAETVDAALADDAQIAWPADARTQDGALPAALQAEAATVRAAITSDEYAAINRPSSRGWRRSATSPMWSACRASARRGLPAQRRHPLRSRRGAH